MLIEIEDVADQADDSEDNVYKRRKVPLQYIKRKNRRRELESKSWRSMIIEDHGQTKTKTKTQPCQVTT